MLALYTTVHLANELLAGEEEDELSDEEKTRLHLMLGKDDEGNLHMLRFQGAFSDALAWTGVPDAIAVASEIEKGRASFGDMVAAMAKAPVNRLASGVTPLIKLPVELATGLKFWPDVFNPSSIRDKGRHFAQTFAMEHEYDLFFQRPSRGYGHSVGEALWTTRNSGEIAYYKIVGLGYDYKADLRGTEGSGRRTTLKSRAVYNWRLAKRFGDEAAEERALEELRELGVKRKDLRASVDRLHPLHMLNKKERRAFYATLDEDERASYRRGLDWYQETFK
jgi:hypothetical protein